MQKVFKNSKSASSLMGRINITKTLLICVTRAHCINKPILARVSSVCLTVSNDLSQQQRYFNHRSVKREIEKPVMRTSGLVETIGPKKCPVNNKVPNVQFTLQKVLTGLKMFIRV